MSAWFVPLATILMLVALGYGEDAETPIGPTAEANLRRASTRPDTAVDLGTLGGNISIATGINGG